jgi:hypothetical protein
MKKWFSILTILVLFFFLSSMIVCARGHDISRGVISNYRGDLKALDIAIHPLIFPMTLYLILFIIASTGEISPEQDPSMVTGLAGYCVFENIVSRLDTLKDEFNQLEEFNKDDYRGALEILFQNRNCRLVKNPRYDEELKRFEQILKARPRPSSWIMRNRPQPEQVIYGERGLSLYFRMIPKDDPWQFTIMPDYYVGDYKIVCIEVKGPDNERFRALSKRIYSIIFEEIRRYRVRSE